MPDFPIDKEKYFWMMLNVSNINVRGINPGEEPLVDFTVTLPMDTISGTYIPESDNFKFTSLKEIPKEAISVIRTKILQHIGHGYES